MMSYYECHITMEDDWFKAKMTVERYEGWKFSRIAGDPNLGDGIKCYATIHLPGTYLIDAVKARLQAMSKTLRECGCNVVREKIELVVYDSLAGD